MDNFILDELMDLAEAYVGPMVDAIYRRLIERDFALEDPEVVMLLTALINILGHDNRGDRPTEVLLMAAYGERGVLDRPNMRVMRWRNGALSGSDLANEPGLGSSRTYQPGEMPMPSKPKPGLTRMHREMNSEATSSGSPLRARSGRDERSVEKYEGKEHSRIILACWLAGLSCKPTPFKSRRKSFNRDIDTGSQKICFILSHILNVQINERI